MSDKQQRQAKPWDLLDKKVGRVSESIEVERMEACNSCEFLAVKICKRCGCFMPGKIKLPNAFCPIGKWGSQVTVQQGE